MAEVADRLRALEDRAAIADLISSYGPLADRGAAHQLSQLWIEEGEYSVLGYGDAQGREEIAALIEDETHQQLMRDGCAHILSPHRIALHGDEAEAVGHSTVLRNNGEGFAVWRVSANRWTFMRTAAGWHIKRRENAPLDGSEAARALLEMKHDA